MRLSFMLRPDQLTIEWADNGLANTSDMENSKRGIANMKERASKLGAALYCGGWRYDGKIGYAFAYYP